MLELDTSDDGRIEWKMEYDIDCDVIRCDEGEVTEDAYLPWSEEKLTVEEVRSFAPSVAVNGRLTVSTAVKAAPDSSFVCAWGSGSIDKCEISGGRALMNGNVLLKYVTIGNGEAVMEEAAIPLKYECDALPGASDTDDASLSRRTMVRVTDIQARQDGDMLNLTAELAISAAALSSERLECAVAISPEGNADTAAKPTMLRVYVPDRGETPWDVEKRFRIGKEISPTENSVYII